MAGDLLILENKVRTVFQFSRENLKLLQFLEKMVAECELFEARLSPSSGHLFNVGEEADFVVTFRNDTVYDMERVWFVLRQENTTFVKFVGGGHKTPSAAYEANLGPIKGHETATHTFRIRAVKAGDWNPDIYLRVEWSFLAKPVGSEYNTRTYRNLECPAVPIHWS